MSGGLRAVVLVHEESAGPALVGQGLQAAGFVVDHRYREVRPQDADAPLWVSMGGYMSSYDEGQYPYLRQVLALMERRLAQGRPTLGICLGAQLLARAAGAIVAPGEAGFELGTYPVTLTAEGLSDPVLGPAGPHFDVVHWHGDAFSEVPGAHNLGATARYPRQAFRLGRSYGLQFHLEVGAERFARWIEEAPDELARARRTVADLQGDVARLRSAGPTLVGMIERLCSRLRGAVGEA
jgi:GMP synthase (glutamine-hydrolysing)